MRVLFVSFRAHYSAAEPRLLALFISGVIAVELITKDGQVGQAVAFKPQ